MMVRSISRIATAVVAVIAIYIFYDALSHENNDERITVLIYETESIEDSPANHLVQHLSRLKNVDPYIFGHGQGFEGYGSKYAAVYPILKKIPSNGLVIITDGRDVLLNSPSSTDKYVATAASEFRTAYDALTSGQYKGAVVISAEAQCCVSALTQITPGSYFNDDGTRNERACSSGEEDCLYKGIEHAQPWETFMQSMAIERTNKKFDDVYLNAGLMAGTATDLIQLIERTNIGKDEDDQAVLTDYMYRYPNAIVLDYEQTMFGNNRGGLSNNVLSYEDNKEDTCMFHLPDNDSTMNVAHDRLYHAKTNTAPLFVHSPGGYLECHDELVTKLGYKNIAKKTRRRLQGRTGCNYSIICINTNGQLSFGTNGIRLFDNDGN